ncbi:hypothetical protein COCHEDRAFT_1022687 [Bipolaris maydis C5]|uniref:Uncharacterized protein n=2 Tax=Cochliobolus heterostrophus TaxID=5016 RepID=M2U684_COCH5|nr:hypothetical protein COCHEDRAFT_1022687 [Bipolaris maydis C5]
MMAMMYISNVLMKEERKMVVEQSSSAGPIGMRPHFAFAAKVTMVRTYGLGRPKSFTPSCNSNDPKG